MEDYFRTMVNVVWPMLGWGALRTLQEEAELE